MEVLFEGDAFTMVEYSSDFSIGDVIAEKRIRGDINDRSMTINGGLRTLFVHGTRKRHERIGGSVLIVMKV